MDISIYTVPLPAERQCEYEAFLQAAGLRDEGDSDIIAWAKNSEGRLEACGSLAGHTLKQFAVSPGIGGTGAMASIMTALVDEAYKAGTTRLFLCTKPANKAMLSSLGFYELVSTDAAMLMENRRNGLEHFLLKIKADAGQIDHAHSAIGAVVCNCDPFTLGHRHLIEYASAHCDLLYIFAVAETESMFSPEQRLQMIKAGTADLANCRVCSSDLYLVSRATFPAYFIRDEEHADEVRSELDIALFAERIAPALGITKRFAGEEPLSPVTRSYNEKMKELLPAHGIEFIEIPRLMAGAGSCEGASAKGAFASVGNERNASAKGAFASDGNERNASAKGAFASDGNERNAPAKGAFASVGAAGIFEEAGLYDGAAGAVSCASEGKDRRALSCEPVSASRVRELIKAGDMEAVRALVPETTYSMIADLFIND